MEDLCPYPFDRTLYMPPFPPHFETPRFNKYRGKGDPRDHVRELFTACIKVAHEDTYLMRLLPKSLEGTTLEWFSHLPPKIDSWGELAKLFITNFSFNIDNLVTLMDLCATRQKEGEAFATFLQRWRFIYHRCLSHIPKVEQVDIFTENLIPQVKYPLQMQCIDTFKEITEKGIKCEKGLLEQGILKHHKDNGTTINASNEKPKFWSKNKNVTNDRVVDACVVNRGQPMVSLQGPVDSFNMNQTQNNNANGNAT